MSRRQGRRSGRAGARSQDRDGKRSQDGQPGRDRHGLDGQPGRDGQGQPLGQDGPLVLKVNPVACDAHGLCIELLPELIVADPWGYPILRPGPVPGELLPLARRAVNACPTLALILARRP